MLIAIFALRVSSLRLWVKKSLSVFWFYFVFLFLRCLIEKSGAPPSGHLAGNLTGSIPVCSLSAELVGLADTPFEGTIWLLQFEALG